MSTLLWIIFFILAFIIIYGYYSNKKKYQYTSCDIGMNTLAEDCRKLSNQPDSCCANYDCVYRINKQNQGSCVRRPGTAKSRPKKYTDRKLSAHCTEGRGTGSERSRSRNLKYSNKCTDSDAGCPISTSSSSSSPISISNRSTNIKPKYNCSSHNNVSDCLQDNCAWYLTGCADR